MTFRDPAAALDCLHSFLHDPWSMMSLRAALAEALAWTEVARLDDQEVLALLAWQLVAGQVRLVPSPAMRPAIQAGRASPAAPEVENVEAPPMPVPHAEAAPAPAVEVVPLVAVAQAATLQYAALLGAPCIAP